MNVKEQIEEMTAPKRLGPFRRAVLRGLGILLPPLLTIVIFLWVGHTVGEYLLEPLENATRRVAVEYFADIRTPNEADSQAGTPDVVVIDGTEHPLSSKGTVTIGEAVYHRTEDGKFVPFHVYDTVRVGVGRDPMPHSAKEIYQWYVGTSLAAAHDSWCRSFCACSCWCCICSASFWRRASGDSSGINWSGSFIDCRW